MEVVTRETMLRTAINRTKICLLKRKIRKKPKQGTTEHIPLSELTIGMIKPKHKNIFFSCMKQDAVSQFAVAYLGLLRLPATRKPRCCPFNPSPVPLHKWGQWGSCRTLPGADLPSCRGPAKPPCRTAPASASSPAAPNHAPALSKHCPWVRVPRAANSKCNQISASKLLGELNLDAAGVQVGAGGGWWVLWFVWGAFLGSRVLWCGLFQVP